MDKSEREDLEARDILCRSLEVRVGEDDKAEWERRRVVEAGCKAGQDKIRGAEGSS